LERKLRTFIAVTIPDSVREKIAEFQEELKQHGADVKWVRPESIHITLKFLGDVEEERIDEVARAVQRAVEGVKPFPVSVGGAGTFPNDRRPRVLWVGVEESAEKLADLAMRIDGELSVLGFERERRKYSGHLTIGRVRSPNRIGPTVEAMHSVEFEGGVFEAAEVLFVKSDLKPTGAVYTALKRIKLQG